MAGDAPRPSTQTWHNRQVVFTENADFRRYLDDLRKLKDQFDVRVHAHCLMTNHVHLLLSPGEDSASGMARLMKTLAGRATRYRNRLEGRSGTLWEGRYKSTPVQTDRYLLACCRYIELNPVRAGMTRTAADYAWSSFRQRMGQDAEDWIDRDPGYLALGGSETERRHRYRRFVRDAVPEGECEFMRRALQRSQLTGDDSFVTEIEAITGRRVEHRGRGRPRRDDGQK